MDFDDDFIFEEDKLGMTLTAGSVTLDKNESNLIGISIGGGGKYCPCLYVVQVFDNTAASREGTLQSGDEITSVNSINVKGKNKTEVAQIIQKSQGTVTINYNKLHPDLGQGKSLDIVLKKVKHRLVETMSSSTADALGLSRAILCNDSLVKKLDELNKAEEMYRSLIDHAKQVFKSFFELIQVYKKFGDVFCSIAVREIQQSANEAFNQFGEAHRLMEKYGIQMLKKLKPILSDLGTYLHKAIPDTKLTIKKYADAKFEYLSYCLKVKEMDDEEVQFAQLQEPLYRVETGNYEYRLVLRCRQDARSSFAKLRSDVLVKLELLDSKHVQHLTTQLTRLVSILAQYHTECEGLMHGKKWFPIELDLIGTALCDDNSTTGLEEYHDEEEGNDWVGPADDKLIDTVEEATENSCQGVGEDLLGQFEGLMVGEGGNTAQSVCEVGNTAQSVCESGNTADAEALINLAAINSSDNVDSLLSGLSQNNYETALSNIIGIPPSLLGVRQQVIGSVFTPPGMTPSTPSHAMSLLTQELSDTEFDKQMREMEEEGNKNLLGEDKAPNGDSLDDVNLLDAF